jgi:glycosyltransferase involved in cell wall biosynthesis
MHVLIVSHNYPTPIDNGFGFFCKHQAEALAQEGHRVGVVGPLFISLKTIFKAKKFYFGFKSFLENRVQTYLWVGFSLPKARGIRYFLLKEIGKRMIDRYVRKYGTPDVLHLHVFVAAEVAIYASAKYNLPLIWTEHFSDAGRNTISGVERKLILKLIVSAKVKIAVSQFLAKRLHENFHSSFTVLPNVYDSNIFKIDLSIKKNENFTFLTVAYMQPIKNHIRMINAFELLSNLPVILIMVGIGDMYETLKRIVIDKNLSNKVKFLGEQNSVKVAIEMNQAHAYIVSSDFETFNVSLVEAMACGVPVVSTKCGGPEQIIMSTELGILTEKTPESLADGMRYIYENACKFSPNILSKYAFENYSLNVIAKKLTDIYTKCV